jgi:arylsulfatase A-like enzyme
VVNDIVQHHDWLPTLLAAAGEPNVAICKTRLKLSKKREVPSK